MKFEKPIVIKKSPTADTRSCDCSEVTKQQLLSSSKQHINDVIKGMNFIAEYIKIQAKLHDYDKMEDIDRFYFDFKNNFETTGWYEDHKIVNRHHLSHDEGIPKDVNLVDVLEYITDCVMAGLARTGKVYDITLDDKILQKAFKNTISLLMDKIKVVDK